MPRRKRKELVHLKLGAAFQKVKVKASVQAFFKIGLAPTERFLELRREFISRNALVEQGRAV